MAQISIDTQRGTLVAQLRALLQLTNTEVQVAETRVVQARTDAVRRELEENAANGRTRSERIATAIRDLGSTPDVVAPLLGRLTAALKAVAEQAQPFDEALLGDLALEHQLLDRARYVKALATATNDTAVVSLADSLIDAHSATVDWLTTVLAEDALGGPAALRRTPIQAATGAAVRLINTPVTWSARSVDRAVDTAREVPTKVAELLGRGQKAGELTVDTLVASRDSALEAAEETTREGGAEGVADAIHKARAATGSLSADELPVDGYDDLNVSAAVAAIKDLKAPADVRTVLAYEEQHKNRHSVVSAAQTRIAAIAKEVVGVE
ncbi:ferritin-like domain-containing protein [Rhodococcus kroppenstedtii]|uniref:ferritin-like domain-containing protein n=1 Tax=Rhodococcoides kroppenstedtii TaxID=293050 RepID=UPI001C9A6706|nr:ferritin-like domain-containing protein [Rhodococcus kroppenstedtii]MBY6435910.1 ferritin-like domain-containing protein [Rhodococcus kroppenstedtii]